MSNKNKIMSILVLVTGAIVGGLLAPMWMVVQLSNGFLTAEYDQTYSAQTAYYLFLGFSVLGGIVSGIIRDHLSGRVSFLVGGAAAAAGAWMAAQSPDSLYLWLGGVGGFGFGALVLATLVAVQDWSPTRKAMAIGLFFTGFALVNANLVDPLRPQIKLEGLGGILTVSAILAVIAGVLGALVMGRASAEFRKEALSGQVRIQPTTRQFNPLEMLKTRQFYQLAVSMIVAFSFYCMVSERIATFGPLKGLEYPSFAPFLSMVAVAVAIGAVGLGALSDYLRRKISLAAFFGVATLGGFVAAKCTGILFWVGSFIAALALGGCLSAFPAVFTDFYGEDHAGKNSAIGLAFYPGALIALDLSANALVKEQNGLSMPFEFAMLIPLVGVLLIFILNRPTAPRVLGPRPAPENPEESGESAADKESK